MLKAYVAIIILYKVVFLELIDYFNDFRMIINVYTTSYE